MVTTQTRIEVLKSAHRTLFEENQNNTAAKALVVETVSILEWTPEQAKVRKCELLWEIGLVLGRGFNLTEEVFLKYVTNVHIRGFIPMTARP